MSGRVFITSDLHLGHTNCARWQGFETSEDRDELIRTNWCSVVDKRDVVWVLGDVAFGSERIDFLGTFPGIKHLVLGNHDRMNMAVYTRVFNKIRACPVWKNRAILTHIPVHPNCFRRWDVPNIHGHIHGPHWQQYADDPRYINVNTEYWNYTPVLLEDLLK